MTPLQFKSPINYPILQNQIVIAIRNDNAKAQVEIRNGTAYFWRYESTNDVFCSVDQIRAYRECSGFDL